MTETVDAVVVGGGLPALAAGATLADEGARALVLDRAPESGAKTPGGLVAGVRGHPYSLDAVVDDLHEAAPLGRPVDAATLHAVAEAQAADLDLDLAAEDRAWHAAGDRAELGAWLADRVHEALAEHGGGVLHGVRADALLRADGDVVGVDPEALEPVRADLVVAADGAAGGLAREAAPGQARPEDHLLQVQARYDADPDTIRQAFGLDEGGAAARFVAGTPFRKAPGAGLLLAGEDAAYAGVVAGLDAFGEGRQQPHALLDGLVKHPLVQGLLPADAEETTYAATLLPGGPRAARADPTDGRLVAVGAAAGHARFRGPLVDPVRPGVAGAIAAARAWADAGGPHEVGQRYRKRLAESGALDRARPSRMQTALAGGRGLLGGTLSWLATGGPGRSLLASGWGRGKVQAVLNDPAWSAAAHGSRFATVALPRALAEETGERLPAREEGPSPASLDERLARARFDADAENAHVTLASRTVDEAGALVHACPTSAPGYTRGAFRFEPGAPDADADRFVAADYQACVECGACALVGPADYEPPRGGKGIRYDGDA